MHAIMVVDMAGFTAAFAHGVNHAIALVRKLREDGAEAISRNGGSLFKASGDNLFALFPDPGKALDAALALRRMNASASTGIGWGEIAFVDDDIFGLELNHASRLGEDWAKAGDVLLTEAAAAWVGLPAKCCTLFKGRTFRWAEA